MKIQMNRMRDENIKLKTKATVMEKDLNSKENMIAELFDSKDLSTIGNIGMKINKRKFESHLTMNLKRQVKDLKRILADKDEEIHEIKRD